MSEYRPQRSITHFDFDKQLVSYAPIAIWLISWSPGTRNDRFVPPKPTVERGQIGIGIFISTAVQWIASLTFYEVGEEGGVKSIAQEATVDALIVYDLMQDPRMGATVDGDDADADADVDVGADTVKAEVELGVLEVDGAVIAAGVG